MIVNNYGSIWEIDHCLPIKCFNLSNEIELRKCFNWVNLRPMYAKENNSNKAKICHRLYLLQEIKAHCFQKLNAKERLNQDFH